jgi:tRNA dimethylallyltransferase
VGGTGLYIRILLHGVVPAPGSDDALRAELSRLDDDALHARLREVDPVSAARLPPRDRVRLIRAIEIFTLTGEPASTHRERHSFQSARHPYQLWVLDPPRDALYAAINARTKTMFEAGLIDETRRLVAAGYRNAAPMIAVGYAQALAVVDGRMTEADAITDVAQKTRHYAKRQWTWFRKEQGARTIQPPYDVTSLL